MKPHQNRIVSFGQSFAKSGWATLILVLIGITYLADFISKMINTYHHPDKLTPLSMFNAAGVLALSITATVVALVRIVSREIESRKVLLLIFIAAGWGGFAPLMQLYPWNYALMLAWVIAGLLISRKSLWESLQE